MLKVLRPGICHEHVKVWEEFLQGYGFHDTEVDNVFDADSVEFTKRFQKKHGLDIDGWVGNQTWGEALKWGLDLLDDDVDRAAPEELVPIVGTHGRMAVWGKMTFEPAGTASNPEAVNITNNWFENVAMVNAPPIDRIPGMQYKGKCVGAGPESVAIHRLVKDSFLELWSRWEEAGLLDRIITWAGTWNPRFIRGSRTSLSNHAFATAFDINAPWNGLRRVPAAVGKRGCIRELVPIANELGWFWGGHFTRRDGMHFEATRRAIQG